MKINLIAVGKRMPDWVNAGFQAYAQRLPNNYALNIIEISAEKRGKNANVEKILEKEGDLILAAIPTNNHIVALDRLGKSPSTIEMANELQQWHDQSQDISLLIGGPEGLSPACIKRAQTTWSLSKLTLPHPLVRIIVAEQLYRCWSILARHPYHR